MSQQKIFMSRQSWPQQKFYRTRQSWACEGWCGTVLCYDRGGHACATDQARRVPQTKSSAHDRGASAIGEFYRDREFCVGTEGKGSKELYVATGIFLVTTGRYVGYGN